MGAQKIVNLQVGFITMGEDELDGWYAALSLLLELMSEGAKDLMVDLGRAEERCAVATVAVME